MSRIAKMPVSIPSGVEVVIKDGQVSVKGSGGVLSLANNALVNIVSNAGVLTFAPQNDSREANAMSGTMRQLVNNMIIGCLLYTSPSPRDGLLSRMPSSA